MNNNQKTEEEQIHRDRQLTGKEEGDRKMVNTRKCKSRFSMVCVEKQYSN